MKKSLFIIVAMGIVSCFIFDSCKSEYEKKQEKLDKMKIEILTNLNENNFEKAFKLWEEMHMLNDSYDSYKDYNMLPEMIKKNIFYIVSTESGEMAKKNILLLLSNRKETSLGDGDPDVYFKYALELAILNEDEVLIHGLKDYIAYMCNTSPTSDYYKYKIHYKNLVELINDEYVINKNTGKLEKIK